MPQKLLLMIPTLAIHDAMGRDLLMGAEGLSKAGFDVKIFAEYFPQELKDRIVSKSAALEILKDPHAVCLYHMGVYWHLLPELVKVSRGKLIVKYHNMTPPRYFAAYDRGSFVATNQGLDQANWLFTAAPPAGLIGASEYNVQELASWTGTRSLTRLSGKTAAIAPFVSVNDLKTASDDPDILKITSKASVNILFVGRLVPNKGHSHLIATLKSYEQLYGNDVQLILCGGVGGGFTKYKADLENLARIGQISDKVVFIHNAGTRELATLYRRSQVFLCMSEHEGFCVPVVEAQMMGLTVVAWDQAAVGSTAGDGAIVLKNLNYDVFATAIHRLQSDPALRKEFVVAGYQNAERFKEDLVAKQHVEFITGL